MSPSASGPFCQWVVPLCMAGVAVERPLQHETRPRRGNSRHKRGRRRFYLRWEIAAWLTQETR